MELGFSGEGFANLLFTSGIIGIFLAFIITIVASKRGIDVSSGKFKFKVIGSIVLVFMFFPFLFSDLDITWKLIGILAAASVGFINYIVVNRTRKFLKDRYK